ncbi:hypothetical protein SAMN05216207_1012131 [Pseudonocardia ammonioxydans]|uniref:Uncharacterized protein n=1 Tax=Pseudonocardia ammonioxydans TaxID=260086 RepID=A0A1I4Y1W7_PSUAM|nr:hypothetical protein [Pseudonocardia ammonioxydans]SFN32015.1 hypothetical protein SAMN05216207_1012131 [Pseudonocardia ammonioxydans]
MTETQQDGAPAAPTAVRRIDVPESGELAQLAGVFDDLQYVLRCCEHLVTALGGPESGPVRVDADPALVEALWSGAVIGYVRCFSGRTKTLTREDLDKLELDGDVSGFHDMVTKLRDHYASRHVNPRESYEIGVAQSNEGTPRGVAVVSTPRPQVDETTVRLLGRVAYALSGLVDARMTKAQNDVLGIAHDMTPAQLAALPLVHLSPEEEAGGQEPA